MDRNYLKGRGGDRSNAVLAAAGFNFSLLLRRLAELLRAPRRSALRHAPHRSQRLNHARPMFFTDDSLLSNGVLKRAGQVLR